MAIVGNAFSVFTGGMYQEDATTVGGVVCRMTRGYWIETDPGPGGQTLPSSRPRPLIQPPGHFEDITSMTPEEAIPRLSVMLRALYDRTDKLLVAGFTKNGAFEVAHPLGRVPTGVSVVARVDGVAISDDPDRVHSDKMLRLVADAAGKKFRLEVF